MNYKNKISVVVCVKNEEKKIKNCLLSIKKNKNVKEIILVDGNSSDRTVDIAKLYVNKILLSKRKNLNEEYEIAINFAYEKSIKRSDLNINLL